MIIWSISANGQNHFLGIKGGVTRTDIIISENTNEDFSVDNKMITGFAGGLTYDFFCNKYVTLGADIIYDQRGFGTSISRTDQAGNEMGKSLIRNQFDYLTVPLKAGFIIGNSVYGFTNLGITPALLVKTKIIYPSELFGETIIIQPKNDNNNFDIGGILELGAGYRLKDRFLFYSSFSFQQSFYTISKKDFNYDLLGKFRHYGVAFNLGMKCALKKE